jgi:hypothetical protein
LSKDTKALIEKHEEWIRNHPDTNEDFDPSNPEIDLARYLRIDLNKIIKRERLCEFIDANSELSRETLIEIDRQNENPDLDNLISINRLILEDTFSIRKGAKIACHINIAKNTIFYASLPLGELLRDLIDMQHMIESYAIFVRERNASSAHRLTTLLNQNLSGVKPMAFLYGEESQEDCREHQGVFLAFSTLREAIAIVISTRLSQKGMDAQSLGSCLKCEEIFPIEKKGQKYCCPSCRRNYHKNESDRRKRERSYPRHQ